MLPEPRPRLAEGIRFYVDEDILGVGYAMMWVRPDVVACGQMPFASRLPRGTFDVDWIQTVSDLGLVAITNNHKIRTNPVEAQVAVSCAARIVGLAGKSAQRSSWDKVTLLTRHWTAIEDYIEKHPAGPWWLAVTQTTVSARDYRPDRHPQERATATEPGAGATEPRNDSAPLF